MTTTKLITGLVIGTGLVLTAAYLISDDGSEIRKKIKKSGEGILDFLCDVLDKGKEAVKEYSGQAEEAVDTVKEKMSGAAANIPANA